MDARQAIRGSLELADMIGMAYLNDLSDAELMLRPHAQCNHLNWQLGHLICSEHKMMSGIAPDAMPELPAGFVEKYTAETASANEADKFASKEQLLEAYRAQRAATLAVLESLSPEDLDKPTGVDYAPTFGTMLRMQGEHWLMHCGQWVIIRRQTDKPVVI